MSFVINNAFDSLMAEANLPVHPTLVVGVSGGADSLYLTLILNEWIKKHSGKLLAVTVDHALRPGSAKEAEAVHQFLSRHAILHEILVWAGDKPKTRIEEKARVKRYQLLCDFCKEQQADALCLAHHQEDQAETFFLRLTRSSGLKGLASMRFQSMQNGVKILRPLLTTSKKNIVETLRKKHIPWFEDSMNYDPSFERVRWRLFQPKLNEMGLTPEIIGNSIQRLTRADAALDFYMHQFIKNHVIFFPENYLEISLSHFNQLPLELKVRIIENLLSSFTCKEKNISLKSIEKIAKEIPKYATLNLCQWVIKKDSIFIALEPKYLPSAIKLSAMQWAHWGDYLVFSTIPCTLQHQAPKPRVKKIPYLIQRTFPWAGLNIPMCFINSQEKTQKELEKSFNLDYKNHKSIVYLVWSKRGD
ncbi:MAG: tRNA lysidine(34) synthetase TilS [Alphaproteobacteria bacterium]|nr:tRNA lysidine(34) synthetase TilS [Alphaproteobacteria bacterium]